MNSTHPDDASDQARPPPSVKPETRLLESEPSAPHAGVQATPHKAIHPAFMDMPAAPYPGLENQTGMPFSSFYLSRYIAFASIAIMAIGVCIAIFFLNLDGDWPQINRVLAAAALWFANLISAVLNTVYWFIRRAPKGLVILLAVQWVAALSGALSSLSQN
ncbi:hypothetical protein GE543_01610 [Pseudomonas sp. SZ57]|uniref:hypothetical protein n=1 Tax=Pseudomonas TaxID=286 RepID=UPI0007602A56|nr:MULTISPECIES: hypothetical protein [Pseudomonas]KWS09725.1 hypothetical protein AL064_01450 [Pseudomonas syringae pv. syringae]MCH5553350.1 hypothetical protein [Pseudomonas syringae pv. syringae]MCH5573359.1 hypothetical protein [Pseudomonas syringae pv. syringae]MCH5665731.1 hypothetical protein [Pseudomonas syringae pv. syringae]MQQ33079.1 hypothetical protein [Pseudomonas sp. SZ57]